MVTARSESKAKDFAERRSRFKDLLEVTITGDLSAVGSFDDLAKDVDVIIHCASVSFDSRLSWFALRANCFGMVERGSTLSSIRDQCTHVGLHRRCGEWSGIRLGVRRLTPNFPSPSHPL